MLKPFILFAIISIIACNAKAQRIYYSGSEGNFSFTQSHIIGQVKDHIIVWKYEAMKPERSQILIYDTKMNILDRVKTGILHLNGLVEADFVNLDECFGVVYQYKTSAAFICKIACFDENGNCFHIQTADSLLLSQAGNETNIYKVIRSANKKSFALVKAFVAKSGNALELRCHLLNSNGAIVHRDSVMLPFAELDANDLFLDNSKNLVVPMSKSSKTYSLMLYKINLETGNVLNTIREIPNGYLAGNTINVAEAGKNYFVTAQWKPGPAEDTAKNNPASGLFFWRLNADLSDTMNDTIFAGSSMDGQFFNAETYFRSSSIVFQNDAVYIISAPNYIASSSNYIARDISKNSLPTLPALNETYPYTTPYDGHLTSIPLNATRINGIAILNNIDPDDNKLPSLPSLSESYVRGNNVVTDNFQFVNVTDLKLFVLRINKSNSILWTKFLDGKSGEGTTSFVNLAKILTTNNTLNLLYAVSGEKEKQIFEKIQFNPDGSFNTEPFFSMKLNYNPIFQKGVAISASAVLFPCVIKNKLAFAKVETE